MKTEFLELPDLASKASVGIGACANPISCELLPNQHALLRGLKILDNLKSSESSARTVYYWQNKIDKGVGDGKSQLLSVTPAWHRCGNRTERFNDIQLNFFLQFIHERYATPMRPQKYRAFKLYEHLAREFHPQYKPLGRSAFERRIDHLPELIAQGRGGKRSANAALAAASIDDRSLQPTRPFQWASIDHYLADIFCVITVSGGKTFTARPWITVMVDRFTKVTLAIWISFRSPSRRACAMIIRRCVKKHGRVPDSIIVDHGAEFESNYFAALLADMGVNGVKRPVAIPKYGSEAERFFGELKTLWLSLRPGNIVCTYERRGISTTHASELNAELEIEDLLEETETFCESRNSHISGSQLRSPNNAMGHGLAMYPFSGQVVAYDERFQIATAIETKEYTVDPQRGIHLSDLWYFHPNLSEFGRLSKSKVEVREEPEDPFRVYACVRGEWITCRNVGDKTFGSKSPTYQVAEALRVLDGRTIRKQAKSEADAHLLESIKIADEKLRAKQIENQIALVLPEPLAPSRFETARKTEIIPLTTLTWENDYALGN